jgi:hypothetical protein
MFRSALRRPRRELPAERTPAAFAALCARIVLVALVAMTARATPQQAPLATVTGDEPAGRFGSVIAPAGDVDGDGHAGIVVGTPSSNRVSLHSGATGTLLWPHSQPFSSKLGAAVAGVADIDGDGVRDILAGAPEATHVESRQGELQLLSGMDGSLLAGYLRVVDDGHLGLCVDELGDADLDGRPELLASAEFFEDGAPDGAFTIWPGGPGNPSWENVGATLPGIAGAPFLLPTGTLAAGEPASLALPGAAPAATATLVVGLSELSAPFKGGTLLPSPDVLEFGLLTDAGGALPYQFAMAS